MTSARPLGQTIGVSAEPPEGLCEWLAEQPGFSDALDVRWEQAALGRNRYPVVLCRVDAVTLSKSKPGIGVQSNCVELHPRVWSFGTVWIGRCPACSTIYWDTEYRQEFILSELDALFERIRQLEATGQKVQVEIAEGRTHVKSRRSYAQRWDANGTLTFTIRINGGARDDEAFDD